MAETEQSPLTSETETIRSSAQWLVSAAAAVGAVLVGALPLSAAFGRLTDRPLCVLLIAAVAFLAALLIVLGVFKAASEVLVVTRVSASDLLKAEFDQRARQRGMVVAEQPGDQEAAGMLEKIGSNAEWLLPLWALPPGDKSVQALYEAFLNYSDLAHSQPGDATLAAQAQALRRYLVQLPDFARLELTRRSFDRLRTDLTGKRTIWFGIAILALAVTLSWPLPDKPLQVTSPIEVEVILGQSAVALQEAGLAAGCTPGMRLAGVAIAGTLMEPVVVTKPTAVCPAARITVKSGVGLTLPHQVAASPSE